MKKTSWIFVSMLVFYIVVSIAITMEFKEIRIEMAESKKEIETIYTDVQNMKVKMENIDIRMASIEILTEEMEIEVEDVVVETNPINWDYNYVLRVVAAESRGEPLEGQMAVAQCIHETAKATGRTPEQVVKQPNQYASPTSIENVNDSVREACERVFIFDEKVTSEPIRYFYSTVGGFTSKWHENSLTYVMTIGNHKFFKAKG